MADSRPPGRLKAEPRYDSIPISAVKNKLAAISEDSWRAEWESSTTGLLTKSFFPTVQDRLNTKLWLTPNLTTLLTGHGRINYYFHRFKIKDSAVCVCGVGDQTVDHVIYDCRKLKTQRNIFIECVKKNGGTWPISKTEMGTKHAKHFAKFAKSIDLDSLQ